MVQIFAAKVIQGMKMLQMCQRQEATGFQKQEIKAQCETRIFNKLLPEILFSRPGLYCTLNLFSFLSKKLSKHEMKENIVDLNYHAAVTWQKINFNNQSKNQIFKSIMIELQRP